MRTYTISQFRNIWNYGSKKNRCIVLNKENRRVYFDIKDDSSIIVTCPSLREQIKYIVDGLFTIQVYGNCIELTSAEYNNVYRIL